MIELAIIVALTVLFLHKITEEGMILDRVRSLLYDLPNFIKKPLFDCPVCMVPWWGMVIMIVGIFTDTWEAPTYFQVFIILAVAGGINAVLAPMLGEPSPIIEPDGE